MSARETFVRVLNGQFGIRLDDVTRAQLRNPSWCGELPAMWLQHGGLLALRGPDLAGLEPRELVHFAAVFGAVERVAQSGRENVMVEDQPILRIGNVRDATGKLRAALARVPQLGSAADIRYNPDTCRPVWHTDSTFREHPPIGSVFHCRQAPPEGAETLFADTRTAFAALDESTRAHLRSLEAVCSLAHHDRKIHGYSPDYPLLTPEQRAANPPRRVPVVLRHPVTGREALYGLNSSTCAVVPRGTPVSDTRMDLYDLDGVEDDSVRILRDLLPHVTGPEFTVCWSWQPGDIVVWDNRCTMHAGTGFDYERHTREMWRLTLLETANA